MSLEYRDILKRYIALVVNTEGVSYIDDVSNPDADYGVKNIFSEDEFAELLKLQEEALQWAPKRAPGRPPREWVSEE